MSDTRLALRCSADDDDVALLLSSQNRVQQQIVGLGPVLASSILLLLLHLGKTLA